MRLFLFFLIFLPFVAKSQVDANFTVSATSGCVPLMVTITNNSTGSGSLTYTWNFGYGPPSSLEDPWPVNYLSPGNYTIVLTVTNGSQTDTQTQLIQVFAKPTAQFTFIGNTEGCIPLDVTFIDQSTPGSAPIVSWDWEFGNGDVSTQQGPQYTYTQPGVFGVLLQVTDTNGCTASVLIDPVVRGSNKPIVQFTADPTNHCIVPLDVQFTNSSNGTPPLSYQWDFGDGGTSASANPAHTYTTLGIYPVSLTVTDAYGCTADTVYTDFIDITGVTASFTTSTGFNTVCPGQAFQFLNTSGNSSVYWDFGTGATSTLEEPFMIYSNPGTYNVTLIAGYGMPCADTIVVPITVQNVQGAVNVTPPSGYSCQLPTTFNLSYNGTPVSSYDWQIETPGGTVTSSASAASAQITQNGSYPYSLVVSTQYGCTDTILDTLSIDAITTSITIVSAPEGCIPFDASFTCTTHSNEPVTNWDWDFGDGGTSNQESPNYTYLGSGTFQVSLTVTNSAGCTATATSEIKTGPHHYPNFEIC